MEELVQLNKRDPLRRNVESEVDTEGMSPMDPPDAYSPTKVEGVDYGNLHPYLQELISEHTPIKEAVDVLEQELKRIKEHGVSRETNDAISKFFEFFDQEVLRHARVEDMSLFPMLHERLLEVGEHSKGPENTSAIDMMADEHERSLQLATIVFSFFSLMSRLPDADSRSVVLTMAVDQAENLVELMRLHLFREEEVVFPLAQKYLSKEQLDKAQALASGK